METGQKKGPQETIDPNNKIKSMKAETISDNRIRVGIDLFEGHSNPTLLLSIYDQNEVVLSHAVILGTQDLHTEFTMHLRKQPGGYPLALVCVSTVDEKIEVDQLRLLIGESE
jgi:hypothetical protein